MAKTLKNIFISLFCGIAMLFAGFFFAACDVDYSKIQLVSDMQVVELEVGQTATVTFTIEGYVSGFSNQVQTNTVATGQASIFSTSQPKYLSQNSFSVQVTALAGGEGQLSMKTLEANKECNVKIVIKQYSQSLSVNDTLLYVSNKTPFVPNSGMFTFDANTTEKQLSYYYIVPQKMDEDFSNLMLKSFDAKSLKATLTDGLANSVDVVRDVVRFESAKMDENNALCFTFEENEFKLDKAVESFSLLSVYEPSIDNAKFPSVLGTISTVHVLPALNVRLSGGYLLADNKVYHYDANNALAQGFEELNFDSEGNLLQPIKIVPNNANLVQYLLRVEMLETDENTDVRMSFHKNNEEVVVDYCNYADSGAGNFKYIKISQNSLRQATTNLQVNVFYALAQQLKDESLNVQRNFEIETQIAPTGITVNGKSEPDALKLYYVHTSPSYGWEDLLVDVVSNFETSPNFEGVYFTFESCIDMMHDGGTVRSGKAKLFTKEDLTKPFRVRAVGGAEVETVIKIHLISDIMQNESANELDIACTILEGARRISLNGIFEPLYVDFDKGPVNFVQYDGQSVGSSILFANDEFKWVSVRHSGGADILNFETFSQTPFVLEDDKFFLNVKATPKTFGTGRYEFILDNGTSLEVSFSCVKSLTGQSTFVRMAEVEGNSYSYASTSRTEGADFDNVLNIEIQNDSSKGTITYGKSASFEILSNATSIEDARMNTAMFVTSPVRNGNLFKLTTLANGDTQISIVLKGLQVQNFARKDVNATVFVNVSSFSLVDEFYLKNGENYALSNTIYYGSSAAQDTSVTFNAVASSPLSNNFMQYKFASAGIETIYQKAIETQDGYTFTINSANFNTLVQQELVYERFNKKFIYFYAIKGDGTLLDNQTQTQATVKFAYKKDGRGAWIFEDADTKQIGIRISNGLMFLAEDFVYEKTNELGQAYEAYSISFSNSFDIGSKGEFDMKTFTFKYKLETENPPEVVMSANVSQRNLTKRYDAHIYPTLFIPTQSISLLSSMENIDFNNEKRTAKISVSLYPSNSTNKDIRAEFVTAAGCSYKFMDILEIDTSRKDKGIFTLPLSCEKFFNNPDDTLQSGEEAKHKSVIEIEEELVGTLYIYPREWGTNFADISTENQPIKVQVKYRNGSKANPYILETAEDVLAINTNEATLKSHYEISNSISMQSVTQGALPIGILDGKIVGFSGSITGTTSQAGISGISVSNNNFFANVNGVQYAGIFAQINAPTYKPGTMEIENLPTLENLKISGKINLNVNQKTYASILAAFNLGQIENVSVGVLASNLSVEKEGNSDLHFGAISAINFGTILQNFTKFDGSAYQFKMFESEILSENGLHYVLVDGKKVTVDSEGFEIDQNGQRVKYQLDANNKLVRALHDFEGQNSKNMAMFEESAKGGTLTISAGDGNIFAGGVVGINNGKIETISPSSSFKLYNYTGYAAYVSISIVGNSTAITEDGNNKFSLYVGAIAGASTNGKFLPNLSGTNKADVSLKNLLVGGEISTLYASGFTDNVGGIVGYASKTENLNNSNQKVEVLQNTSRAFLRGGSYVGAIVGFDDFKTESGNNVVNFESGNRIEAVDDGRSSVMGASIIRKTSEPLQEYVENIKSISPDETDEQKLAQRNVLFAVGNGFLNVDKYISTGAEFSSITYVQRKQIETLSESFLSPESGSVSEYYGDFLLVTVQEETENLRLHDALLFKFSKVEVQLEENDFVMTLADGSKDLDVFFMFYFHVETDLSAERGALAQDDILSLNTFSPNSNFYPFKMQSQDVSINISSSNILSVDTNGALIAKATGHATINLSSILNVMVSREIHIFVVNFFDKNIQENSSIFFSAPTLGGSNFESGSDLPILGNSVSQAFVVPTYSLDEQKTVDGQAFSISRNGILTYQNVSYQLSRNTQLTILEEALFVKYDSFQTDETGNYVLKDGERLNLDKEGFVIDENGKRVQLKKGFSSAQINQQNIIFFKSQETNEGDLDTYQLVPVLKVDIQGQTYYYFLKNSRIKLNVVYHEAATAISTIRTSHRFATNGHFEDSASITTTNPNELLFYSIESRNGNEKLVQTRLPDNLNAFSGENGVEQWQNFMATNFADENSQAPTDLFDLTFERVETANGFNFNFVCRINTQSSAYKQRYEAGKSIFGEYIFKFYTSLLQAEGAPTCTMRVQLDEATLSYVNVENFSNFNNLSMSDNVIVPTQRGLLEISLDPVDAVFEKFSIANNIINSRPGAGEALFTFAYQKQSNLGVEYVLVEDFGRFENGAFTFTSEEMKKRLESIKLDESKNEQLGASNKIYISYFLPSNSVEDDAAIAFDVRVTYGNGGNEVYETTLPLRTKLGSFARLQFANKEKIGDAYFVARGLSYDMILDAKGFAENQIQFSVSHPQYVSIEKQNGKYMLRVTKNDIIYSDDVGFALTITTKAEKIVDNVKVSTEDVLQIYLMEYVLQYQYVEGVNEDLVRGMFDGIISTAIGNPHRLEFAIREFLEYDQTSAIIAREVDTFVAQMTQNLQWKVWEDGQETQLMQGKNIRSATDHYQISSFTVTPTKIYSPLQNVYHFSVGGNYEMKNGSYSFAEIVSEKTNALYTEFSFDVHQQSTQESPIPVETYEDLLNMHEGQWYILLDNITLPSVEYAAQHNCSQFMPLSTQIAGLDGNGFAIRFAGTYNFDGLTEVGLFGTVGENMILRNVKIELSTDVKFNMNVETFNVGLLAANNNGIIANCSVVPEGTSALTVEDSVTATTSYVAALVAQNSGFITNSQSSANIFSKVNLSGFVGTNNGHIASSFFRGGKLINNTNTTNEFTAGFVVQNSGEIYASYVSGDDENNQESAYYNGDKNFIQASGNISGFAYTNSGQIYDCYSNIHLSYSGFFASGFVFENTGRVERCFSTSVLESEQTRNYGFVRTNTIQISDADAKNGIYDCFYLSDVKDGKKINQDIGSINTTDGYTNVTPIRLEAFRCVDESGKVNKFFENFVISSGRNTNSVWFYNNNQDDTQNFKHKKFNTGRIELVAANIVATSHRKFDHTENVIDPETGASYVKYVYVFHEDSPLLGSEFNPILISNSEEFETYIVQENNLAGFNNKHYRLLCDINFEDVLHNSITSETKFIGYFEGNFMTVQGQSLVSSKTSKAAGLFAEVGNSSISDAIGTVMNFTFLPAAVDFANVGSVGAIAGILDGGTIVNISVEGEGTVVGNNIVGGAVGTTIGNNFKMQNVFCQFSAKARNKNVLQNNQFDENLLETSMTGLSFAGSLIGAASGKGSIRNCVLNDAVVSVIANKTGLLFGLVDENVSVSKVRLLIDKDMFLNGFEYAGLVVGESKGNFVDVEIANDGTTLPFKNFGQTRFGKTAIGGFAGLISGGELDDVRMNQSISISSISTSNGVANFGGIAGRITSMRRVANISMQNVNLVGFANVGAVAGSFESKQGSFENMQLSKITLEALGVGQTQVGVGGIAGFVGADSVIALSSTKKDEKTGELVNNTIELTIKIETSNYGTGTGAGVTVSMGVVVGSEASVGAHSLKNVNSNIEASCTVTDLSKTEQPVKGNLDFNDATLSPQQTDLFDVRVATAENCSCSCNVTFTVSIDEDKKPVCALVVNLHDGKKA